MQRRARAAVDALSVVAQITNEPPKGLRANLLRSYGNLVNRGEFETCKKPAEWKKLLFGLCFFHAVVQERKVFGPLGWNKLYEFNDSDLETSMQVPSSPAHARHGTELSHAGTQVVRMMLDEQAEIPWDALRYVCGEVSVGGGRTPCPPNVFANARSRA